MAKGKPRHRDTLVSMHSPRGGYAAASRHLERFRDVVCEVTGFEDENPGDDVSLGKLRAMHGRTGPEPTRWRDFLTGATAVRDQILAERRDRA